MPFGFFFFCLFSQDVEGSQDVEVKGKDESACGFSIHVEDEGWLRGEISLKHCCFVQCWGRMGSGSHFEAGKELADIVVGSIPAVGTLVVDSLLPLVAVAGMPVPGKLCSVVGRAVVRSGTLLHIVLSGCFCCSCYFV